MYICVLYILVITFLECPTTGAGGRPSLADSYWCYYWVNMRRLHQNTRAGRGLERGMDNNDNNNNNNDNNDNNDRYMYVCVYIYIYIYI